MNNEDEDELDPCTITPERSISPVITTSATDASNRLPPLEDILACLECEFFWPLALKIILLFVCQLTY